MEEESSLDAMGGEGGFGGASGGAVAGTAGTLGVGFAKRNAVLSGPTSV